MKKLAVLVVAVVLGAVPAVCNSASSRQEDKATISGFWSKTMDITQKGSYFLGLRHGIDATNAYSKIPGKTIGDLMEEFPKYQSCIEKDFDMVYAQGINITPMALVIFSFEKCRGKRTQAQFQKDIKDPTFWVK